MENFSDLDFRILNFINLKGPIHINEIKHRFRKVDGIENRIKNLSKQKFGAARYIPNTSMIIQQYEEPDSLGHCKPTGIYEITDLGKISLQDYKYKNKKYMRSLWLKNAWIPILVSVATNLVIAGIQQLLPLLREWLLRFL